MKKISLKNIDPADKSSVYIKRKLYSIYLSEGRTFEFANKKDAVSFLADINRHLNMCLYELNMIYSQLYVEYRENWYYFLSDYRNANTGLIRMDQNLRKCFDSAQTCMDRIVFNTRGINGHSFVYSFFKSLCDALTQAATYLRQLHRLRSQMAQSAHMDIVAKRIARLQADIINGPAR